LPSLAFSNGNFLETSGNPSNFPNFDRPPLPGPEPRHGPEPVFDLFRFRESFLFQFLMIVILSLMLKLNDRLKVMKSEKLKSEVSYLKAQINPHFLFNTLNSIYALTLIKSDKAPNAVLKLSDMMRYVVTESDTEKVPLEKELQYISDYIELQKLRIGNQVNFTFKVDGDPKSKTIVPIILINYIENAFKYGVNPDKPSKIVILIFIDSQGIRMTVENDIVVNDFMTGENTGEGSKNTAKRLDFHYPNKYHLDISQVNGSYKTTLYINLT
jgi:LytS/YehU family sensor histidine kinase